MEPSKQNTLKKIDNQFLKEKRLAKRNTRSGGP